MTRAATCAAALSSVPTLSRERVVGEARVQAVSGHRTSGWRVGIGTEMARVTNSCPSSCWRGLYAVSPCSRALRTIVRSTIGFSSLNA